jgi:hypothetical protein
MRSHMNWTRFARYMMLSECHNFCDVATPSSGLSYQCLAYFRFNSRSIHRYSLWYEYETLNARCSISHWTYAYVYVFIGKQTAYISPCLWHCSHNFIVPVRWVQNESLVSYPREMSGLEFISSAYWKNKVIFQVFYPLGHNVMQSVESQTTFRRNTPHPFSGSNKPCKKLT